MVKQKLEDEALVTYPHEVLYSGVKLDLHHPSPQYCGMIITNFKS